MNTMAVQFGDTLYFKEPFLLWKGHQRGIQRIVVQEPHQENGEWRTRASIYPRITSEMLEAIAKLPEADRKTMLDYVTAPTEEWGRASSSSVKMSTMQQWLPEIAVKRAICRALRLFAGIGSTVYEELPEAVVDHTDLEQSRRYVIQDEKPKPPALSPAPATETSPAKPARPAATVTAKSESQPTAWTDTT